MTARRTATNTALTRAARAMSLSAVVHGLTRWIALSSGSLLTLIVADSLLNLPTALRLPFVLSWIGFVLYDFSLKVCVPLFRPITPAQAARILEVQSKIPGNILINAFHFENDPNSRRVKKFTKPTLASSRTQLNSIRPAVLWKTNSVRKWIFATLLVGAIGGAAFAIYPRYLEHSLDRILMPLSDIPPLANWDLQVTPAGPVSVVEGDKLDISVHVTSLSGSTANAPTPQLVWKTGSADIEPSRDDGQHAEMIPVGDDAGHNFTFSFDAVPQSFSFRVWVENAYSPAVSVQVIPLPHVKLSSFVVTPPAYTGLKALQQPGPPTEVQVPAGSSITATLQIDPDSTSVAWREKEGSQPMTHTGASWTITLPVNDSRFYSLMTAVSGQKDPRMLCQGQITSLADRPPDVEFITKEHNLLVNPGGSLPLTIAATDDYGVAAISLFIAPGDDPSNTRLLKSWHYMGPPGEKEPVPENYTLTLDPGTFTPGATFLLTAQATDFSPKQQHGTSHPVVLRVASLDDLSVAAGDPLEQLVALIKCTIVQQTKANGLTDNLAVHLSEALAHNDLPQHHRVIGFAQNQAHDLCGAALTEALKRAEAKQDVLPLQTIANGEMPFAQSEIEGMFKGPAAGLSTDLPPLQSRQAHILSELIALLGQIVNDRQKETAQTLTSKTENSPPSVTSPDAIAKLKDDLKSFIDKQKRLIDATKSLKDLNPEDLTSQQEEMIGKLAREEAQQAKFFQDKLTDLSNLPLQDFGDGKTVSDANEVYQEVQAAAQALYQKRPEIAVPNQQAALENASKIEQNLEKWLPNSVDNTKWTMEESKQQADAAMAELPKQLDDVIGDLMQKEEDLDPQEEQDASNTAMDSLDKGAGWGAADGPMANMSAKGVTGNQLPKNDEIGGRSGEGRNGRSDGQMVGDTASGKGGKETPTRLTATPFEPGSVNDTSTDTKGGATGGGKLSGAGQDGLRGPLPPPTLQRLAYVADQQSKLRQQAENLALQLRKQRKSTGDLESAINAMNQMQVAAQKHDGLGVLQCYHDALSSLSAARASYSGDRVSRVEANSLQTDANSNVSETEAEHAPPGYEEMTGAYFRSLSDAQPSK